MKSRVIGPVAPKATKLPRWVLPVFAAALAGSLFFGVVPALAALVFVPGAAGAFALALWLEDRIATPYTHHPFVVRLGVLAGVVAAGLAANVVVGGVLRPAAMSAGVGQLTVALLQLVVFWFLSAAVGGLPIVVANSLVGALFKGFKRRVQVAVLMLVGAAVFVSVAIAVVIITLVDAVSHHEPHFLVSDGSIPLLEVSVEQFENVIIPIIDNPAILVLFATLVGGLYGIPALLSATGKLADAIMERVSPLAEGFDALAAGERGVTLEEGGADEMRAIIKRFNAMVASLELAERMERAFGQYVSGHVLDLIKSQHGEGALPASLRDATVFFADIRGFTTMSERLAPEQVVALLNRYFERVIAVIDAHHGYLNKFIGDAVVVVFNGPIEQPDHAARATRCAIEIQKLVDEMNARALFPEVGRVEVGIGVSTGPMVCGNVGGSRQMEYTVIGDTVNLAARLTSKAGAGEVWISDATARALGDALPCIALAALNVKGKEQPVTPWRAWPVDAAHAAEPASSSAPAGVA